MNKHELRSEIRKKIQELDDKYISCSDWQIYETLISLPIFRSARRVFLYNSIGREIDTKRIMAFCVDMGIPFALPRTFPGGRMEYCQIDDTSILVPKKPYNIYEPPDSLPSVMPTDRDVIIVPGLCFGENLFRLGHGAGYFDRFLSACPAFSIGICRERLILPQIPRESRDIPVESLISEVKMRNR